jgi:hypothetical protein
VGKRVRSRGKPGRLPLTTYRGRILCHYCRTRFAWTRDHVVPKAIVPPFLYGSGSPANHVWACLPCNQAKANNRSTCMCLTCRTAWAYYGPANWIDLYPTGVDPAEIVRKNPQRFEKALRLHEEAEGTIR